MKNFSFTKFIIWKSKIRLNDILKDIRLPFNFKMNGYILFFYSILSELILCIFLVNLINSGYFQYILNSFTNFKYILLVTIICILMIVLFFYGGKSAKWMYYSEDKEWFLLNVNASATKIYILFISFEFIWSFFTITMTIIPIYFLIVSFSDVKIGWILILSVFLYFVGFSWRYLSLLQTKSNIFLEGKIILWYVLSLGASFGAILISNAILPSLSQLNNLKSVKELKQVFYDYSWKLESLNNEMLKVIHNFNIMIFLENNLLMILKVCIILTILFMLLRYLFNHNIWNSFILLQHDFTRINVYKIMGTPTFWFLIIGVNNLYANIDGSSIAFYFLIYPVIFLPVMYYFSSIYESVILYEFDSQGQYDKIFLQTKWGLFNLFLYKYKILLMVSFLLFLVTTLILNFGHLTSLFLISINTLVLVSIVGVTTMLPSIFTSKFYHSNINELKEVVGRDQILTVVQYVNNIGLPVFMCLPLFFRMVNLIDASIYILLQGILMPIIILGLNLLLLMILKMLLIKMSDYKLFER